MARNQSTVYVGNLSEKVTEDLLYELFIQAGPVASINIPTDRGRPKSFGFVQFKHPCSVLYAVKLFEGLSMFGKPLRVNLPKGSVLPGPMVAPMGLPAMPRMDLLPKPSMHPRAVHGRLGPPTKPVFGHRGNDEDREESRDRNRSRRRDDMMPSDRTKKTRQDADDFQEFDLDALPDLLDPFGPPIPSHGPPQFPHGHSRRREHQFEGRREHQYEGRREHQYEGRREHPYEDRRERHYESRGNNHGSHRSHHDTRRDRHSHRSSNNRRQF